MIGEANFSDHGANRLGASALMQGLADGYFVLPNTIGDYLADGPVRRRSTTTTRRSSRPRRRSRTGSTKLLSINGNRTVDSFHRELGQIMWDYCGMERTEEGLRKAIGLIRDAARGVLDATSRCPAPARSSTRPWRRPAGSPTSSSSPS